MQTAVRQAVAAFGRRLLDRFVEGAKMTDADALYSVLEAIDAVVTNLNIKSASGRTFEDAFREASKRVDAHPIASLGTCYLFARLSQDWSSCDTTVGVV